MIRTAVLPICLFLCLNSFTSFPAEARLANSPRGFQQAKDSQSAELAEAERLSNSAAALYNSGKYIESLQLLRRALEIRERVVGPEDVLVARTLTTLGEVYMLSDRQDDARKVLQRSLAILEARPSPDDLLLCTVLEDLGNVNFVKYDYEKAQSLLQRSLTIKEKTLSPDDLQIAIASHRLARVFEMQKKYAEADSLYVRAIRIREDKLGRSHPITVATMKGYACLNIAMNRPAPANKKLSQKDLPELKRSLAMTLNEDTLKNRASCWLAGFQDDCGTETAKQIESQGTLNGLAVKLAFPTFPNEARARGVSEQIQIYVAVLIDEGGNVVGARSVCGARPSFAKTSETAAFGSKFEPTLRDGKPTKVRGILAYNYVSQ